MRPTRALIHREHLISNVEEVRKAVPSSTALCAAVKADAYGHSVGLVVPWLVEAGVESFCVATVEEGVQLRRLGMTNSILLLGTWQPEELADAVEADLDLFLWTEEGIAAAAQAAAGRRSPLRVHLKVDTGMGRVGCRPEQAEELAQAIVHSLPLEFTGICTHLASSDGPGPLSPQVQLDRFHDVLSAIRARGWTPRFVHAANSGGIVAWPSSYFNLVRPGIVLYGYPPFKTTGYQPVMELVSRVGFVKEVPPQTPLSYGSRYVTTQTTDVATIPLGYADGYRRALTNRGQVWIGDRLFTVSGTVCMDQFLVDLGPNSGVKAGDPVVLFGPAVPGRKVQAPTADDLAEALGTITYEVLCGISARVPRVASAASL